MMKKFFEWTGIFESHLSAAEWAWRIITLMVVVGGGTTAGLLAKGSQLFSALGPLAWMAIGLFAAGIVSLIFFLVKLGNLRSAESAYFQTLTQPRTSINPLAESFTDQIIYLPDLYLPRKQLHSHKLFKRCKIVGPGAIAILGGSYVHSGFIEAGSLVVLPENTYLTGVLVFENCTVEHCEFIGVTLLVNKQAGEAFKAMGAPVVGL
ncbi:hypothetical protein QF022_002336 [Vogesella perlucida]|nr:hypothetical protein [Vogesella perlucida]